MKFIFILFFSDQVTYIVRITIPYGSCFIVLFFQSVFLRVKQTDILLIYNILRNQCFLSLK